MTYKDTLKALFAKALVRVIKLLTKLKRPVLRMLSWLSAPLRLLLGLSVGVAVPVARGYGAVRRGAKSLHAPAKNKLMVFVTHRYIIHVIVASLAVSVVWVNLKSSDVRAESFGENSAMYQLVAGDQQGFIEEFAITPEQLERAIASGSLDESALSAFTRGIDSPSVVGGSTSGIAIGDTLTPRPTLTTGDSTASRTGIETYAVKSGDVLGAISEKFGISLETLLWANNLTSGSSISPGDELTILPTTGITYTVKSGDTLSKIASTYDISQDEISEFNGLSGGLGIGDELIIPGGRPISRVARPTSRPASTPSPAILPAILPSSSSVSDGMIWPTDLQVITQYYGWSHTGIDIDCYNANLNYAAADGVVTYSGWRNGYGYTVEVDHGGGLTTRYGHHKSLAVSTGQSVVQGQAVGVCGTSGRSTGTHIHFEVMINGRFQNPLSYIR